MNIAELFVNLGIKGADKTVGALTSVKKGLGEVSSMSLEAKAGILAALYGLEQMAAKSGAAGTGLTNFAALTGLSAKTLQQWQYAARQAGVSGEELTGSLKAVQNSMTNMLLGKGAPEGLGVVAKAVGFDPRLARNSFYVMEQLQKAAQALPKDVGNNVLKSFGLSEGTIAAMRLNKFNPAALAKAPIYGDKEIESLNRSNVAWGNLGQKIEMAFGHFNAKHGLSLVKDISKLTTEIFKMVDAFERLAEKLKFFQLIGKAFEGWGMIFNGISGAVDTVMKFADSKTKGKDAKEGMSEFLHTMALVFSEVKSGHQERVNQMQKELANEINANLDSGKGGNTTVHQKIIHHGDAKDTKSVKDLHKHAVGSAYRQRAAQGQGS